MLTSQILQQSASRNPNKTALIYKDRRLTYGELAASADRFAHAIAGQGIGAPETVAILSRNLPEYVVAHFGNAQTGALLVNLMPAYAPEELVTILGIAKARLIVVEAAFLEKITQIIDQLPNLSKVVVIGEPPAIGRDLGGRCIKELS